MAATQARPGDVLRFWRMGAHVNLATAGALVCALAAVCAAGCRAPVEETLPEPATPPKAPVSPPSAPDTWAERDTAPLRLERVEGKRDDELFAWGPLARVWDPDTERPTLAFDSGEALGVRFTQPPVDHGTVVTAVLDDTCGNLIQIAAQKDES